MHVLEILSKQSGCHSGDLTEIFAIAKSTLSQHLKEEKETVRNFNNQKHKTMDVNDLRPANMEIKVLGTGCSKCNALEKATRKAVEELEIKALLTKN